MQAILIGSGPGREKWLLECLDHLQAANINKDYSLIVMGDPEWELNKFRELMEKVPECEEFFFLPDSVMVKDGEIFDIAFRYKGSYAMGDNFIMFLGKYRRAVLDKMEWPVVQDKTHTVQMEHEFNQQYMEQEPNFTICNEPMHDTDTFEEHNGRNNMIIENRWLKKYKGHWTLDML